MTSKELNFKLTSLLPEIKNLFADTVSWQEGYDTGSHVVFEDVLVPYIIECARKQNQPRLFKCFEAVEKILLSNDEYAEEVIAVSVLESLLFENGLGKELSIYMGQKTKNCLKKCVADGICKKQEATNRLGTQNTEHRGTIPLC